VDLVIQIMNLNQYYVYIHTNLL